jgi:hypothetical protein
MSRGTRITPLRLPPDLLAQIDLAIASNNVYRVAQDYNRTSWIVQAIKERLAKLERSRSGRHKRKATAAAVEEIPADEDPPERTEAPSAYDQGGLKPNETTRN